MFHKVASLSVAVGLVILIGGCVSGGKGPAYGAANASFTGEPGAKVRLANVIYQAAEVLTERAVYLDKTRAIIVATVVSVDDLEKSSTFGRLASQLVANRIAQRGYLVSDVTYMRGITLQPSGELVLTREASQALKSAKVQAVVAGTYAVAGKEVYLNLRLLNADTGEVLSSADAVIPLDDNVTALFSHASPSVPKMSYDRFEELAQQSHIIK